MKQNKIKLYAKALAGAILAKGADGNKITDNFVKLLITDGYEKKAGEILNLAENFLLAKQGKKKITFETARKVTAGQKKMLAGIAETGDVINEKINSELVAGVKVVIDGNKQLDMSMASTLSKIFK